MGTVLLRLNGSDVTSVLQGCKDLTSKECTVSLRGQPTWIEGGVNRVAAEAGNRDDTVRSRGLDLSVEADGLLATDPPELWVLAVGVSDYAGDDLDLDFAAEDAQELSNALRLAGHHGFAKPNTHVRVLTTSGGERPSHTALTDAFRWLEASEPHDTVIVFLAGHGVAMADPARGVDDYFYLLPDARSLDDVRDPQLRALRAWSGTQLADALSQVGALKRVVILDTCAAGRAHTSLLAQRDLSSDAIRAHARARERTGAWLLAGAAADQVSYEASRYGQGVLTYTLLDGMRGPAVDGANQLLVSRLFAHAETHVQTNARGVGGIQIPVVRRGEGDFPIGAMPPEARSAIEVRRLRPVMVRSSVQGEGGRRDTLGFADLLDAALRDASAQPDAPFVAWDSPPAPDTWQITGQIVASEDSLRFEGFLTWQGEAVKEHPISAAAADLDALTTVVLQQVRSAL
ncbi:MAG: caspase family protein [Myxococcales bacterium]|nr:caspase family protein [Myxococcales bacterium]